MRGLPQEGLYTPVLWTPATAAANTAVVVTLVAPGSEDRQVIYQIDYSYTIAAPTIAAIQVESPSGTIIWGPYQLPLGLGSDQLYFFKGLYLRGDAGLNKAMIVTLAAGGGTTVGFLNVCSA